MTAGGGILLVDKPAGMTSFQVVDRIRKALLRAHPDWDPRRTAPRGRAGGPRPPRFKCGHAGTLDPLATGLLIVLVGRCSRLGPFLLGLDKRYLATVRFGAETVSHDREGEVVRTAPVPDDPAPLIAALDGLRGEILQVPPRVSALKRDGAPLHRLMRRGGAVAPPAARPVTISDLTVAAVRWAAAADGVRELDLDLRCTSGTYVRALARDLGRAAGTAACIQELRRLEVGAFEVADALAWRDGLPGAELAAALLPGAAALPGVPRLPMSTERTAAVLRGGQPAPDWLAELDGVPAASGPQAGLFVLLAPDGALAAVGRTDDGGGPPRIAAVLAAPGNEEAPCD